MEMSGGCAAKSGDAVPTFMGYLSSTATGLAHKQLLYVHPFRRELWGRAFSRSSKISRQSLRSIRRWTMRRSIRYLIVSMVVLFATGNTLYTLGFAAGPGCNQFCNQQTACNGSCPVGCTAWGVGKRFDCCCTLTLPGDPTKYCCAGQCWKAICKDASGRPCHTPPGLVCGAGMLADGECVDDLCRVLGVPPDW